jgi:hypothetical protein
MVYTWTTHFFYVPIYRSTICTNDSAWITIRGLDSSVVSTLLTIYKGKAMSSQAWTGPWGSRKCRLWEFIENRNIEVVRFSALRTGCLYPPESIAGTHFCTEFYKNPTASAANTGKFPFDRIRRARLCVIASFLRKADEFCAPMGVYAA